jgi:hypothetical protein
LDHVFVVVGDLRATHVPGMAFTVKENEATNPVDKRLNGRFRMPTSTGQVLYLVEEFGRLHGGRGVR